MRSRPPSRILNVVILHYHPGKGPPSPGAVTITTLPSVLQPQLVHPPEPPQPEPPYELPPQPELPLVPSQLPLPLVHLVSLRSLIGRLGKTGVGTSHKPRRYFQSGHQHKYRGPGPGPSNPINIPGGSPPTPLRPPALAPGSSLLRVADTFRPFATRPAEDP